MPFLRNVNAEDFLLGFCIAAFGFIAGLAFAVAVAM